MNWNSKSEQISKQSTQSSAQSDLLLAGNYQNEMFSNT